MWFLVLIEIIAAFAFGGPVIGFLNLIFLVLVFK